MQLVIPQLALTGTPEAIFITRLVVENATSGGEVKRMIAGQKWLAKNK